MPRPALRKPDDKSRVSRPDERPGVDTADGAISPDSIRVRGGDRIVNRIRLSNARCCCFVFSVALEQ